MNQKNLNSVSLLHQSINDIQVYEASHSELSVAMEKCIYKLHKSALNNSDLPINKYLQIINSFLYYYY